MIRINLLSPAETKKKKRQISAGGSYGAILILVLVLEVLGLYYWGDSKSAALEDKTRAVSRIEADINKFKALKQQQTDLETKIDEEKQQTEIFKKLKAGRVGPGNMLLYLSYILTRPHLENRGERVIQEQLGWNTGWDTDRAWFESIRKSGKGVEISGKALTHKDTDEVLKRLRCSIYLQNLQLISSAQSRSGGKRGVTLIEFAFKTDLNFDINVGKAEADSDEHEKKKHKARMAAEKKG